MPKLIFYDYVVAYFPARVRLLLNEQELAYQYKSVDIFYCENMSNEFAKLSKNMTLPVLSVDGRILTQSMEICDYLVTLKPFGKESDPVVVNKFVDLIKDWDGNCWSEMQLKGAGLSFFNLIKQFKQRYCQARLQSCTDPELKQAYENKLSSINQGFSQQDKQECRDRLKVILDAAREALNQTQFLGGKDYSLADVLMTSLLVRLKDAGTIKKDLASHPQISDYFSRVQSRPTFKKTFAGVQFVKVFSLIFFRDIPVLFFSKLTGWY